MASYHVHFEGDVALPPTGEVIMKQGRMRKRGGTLIKKWKEHIFVLGQRKFEYYHPDTKERKGVIATEHLNVIDVDKFPTRFDVVTSLRSLHCEASSVEEKNEWMEAFREAKASRHRMHVKAHEQIPPVVPSTRGGAPASALHLQQRVDQIDKHMEAEWAAEGLEYPHARKPSEAVERYVPEPAPNSLAALQAELRAQQAAEDAQEAEAWEHEERAYLERRAALNARKSAMNLKQLQETEERQRREDEAWEQRCAERNAQRIARESEQEARRAQLARTNAEAMRDASGDLFGRVLMCGQCGKRLMNAQQRFCAFCGKPVERVEEMRVK